MLIETQTIKGKPILIKLWRDSSTHDRQFQIISDFRSYFFVETNEESEFKTINGENLKKIEVFNPYDINDLKTQFDQTWEADISYPHKYILDNIELPIKKGWNRILYWDIETNTSKNDSFPDPHIAPHEICEICTYDNLKKEYHHFTTEHQSEYEMLKQFINYVRECNFDIWCAWNSSFDETTLYHRLIKNNINPNYLSPLNYTFYNKNYGVKIKGIALIDLLEFYKNLHFSQLESFSLNSVASYELDKEKIHTELPGDLLKQNRWKDLIKYCERDVQLMVELDNKMNLIDFYYNLHLLAGTSSTVKTGFSTIHDLLLLRKAHKRGIRLPSRISVESEQIKGGYVVPPIPGLHENVGTFDIAAMYISIIRTLNLGFENITTFPTNNSIKIKTDDNLELYIDQNKKTLWVEVIEDIVKERARYKKLMHNEEVDSEKYKLYDMNQRMYKSLLASIYGVSNFSNFRNYNYQFSKIITFFGRQMNFYMQEFAKNQGYQVIAGDTDSIHIKEIKSIKEGQLFEEKMNNSWDEFLKSLNLDNLLSEYLKVEFEALYDRFFITEAKKRYVNHYIWKDGSKADGINIKGFGLKRSDISKFSKKFQENIFNIILKDPISNINKNLAKLYRKSKGDIITAPLIEIGIPKGFSKDPRDYKVQNLNTKAVIYSQKHLGLADIRSTKPLIYSVKRMRKGSKLPFTESVAIDPESEDQLKLLEENFIIDYKKMIPKLIDRQIEEILKSLGTSLEDANTRTKQKSLFDF